MEGVLHHKNEELALAKTNLQEELDVAKRHLHEMKGEARAKIEDASKPLSDLVGELQANRLIWSKAKARHSYCREQKCSKGPWPGSCERSCCKCKKYAG